MRPLVAGQSNGEGHVVQGKPLLRRKLGLMVFKRPSMLGLVLLLALFVCTVASSSSNVPKKRGADETTRATEPAAKRNPPLKPGDGILRLGELQVMFQEKFPRLSFQTPDGEKTADGALRLYRQLFASLLKIKLEAPAFQLSRENQLLVSEILVGFIRTFFERYQLAYGANSSSARNLRDVGPVRRAEFTQDTYLFIEFLQRRGLFEIADGDYMDLAYAQRINAMRVETLSRFSDATSRDDFVGALATMFATALAGEDRIKAVLAGRELDGALQALDDTLRRSLSEEHSLEALQFALVLCMGINGGLQLCTRRRLIVRLFHLLFHRLVTLSKITPSKTMQSYISQVLGGLTVLKWFELNPEQFDTDELYGPAEALLRSHCTENIEGQPLEQVLETVSQRLSELAKAVDRAFGEYTFVGQLTAVLGDALFLNGLLPTQTVWAALSSTVDFLVQSAEKISKVSGALQKCIVKCSMLHQKTLAIHNALPQNQEATTTSVIERVRQSIVQLCQPPKYL